MQGQALGTSTLPFSSLLGTLAIFRVRHCLESCEHARRAAPNDPNRKGRQFS